MDNNQPADHFQMPAMIKLKSSDGEVLEVEAEVAKLSLTIKEMLDDLGLDANEVIPIPENAPEISGTILKKIIEWANHHKNDLAAAEDDENEAKPTDDISSWDAEFLQVDQSTLFQLIQATDYLIIKALFDLTCKKVANLIKGMSTEEVQVRFNIQKDFDPTETDQIFFQTLWSEEFGETLQYKILEPRRPVQNVDHEADQVVKDCFRNAFVVRKVLEHISNKDLLLELQFVNKLWNYEARSVMRDRGNVFARLKCVSYDGYSNLQDFGEQLRQMNVVPYSELVLVVDHSKDGYGKARSSDVNSTYEAILHRLPLKYLSVKMNDHWVECERNCPVLRLLKKLLPEIGGVLEELTLNIKQRQQKCIEEIVQNCSFPALKILRFEGIRHVETGYMAYMKALVSRAENLQELHTFCGSRYEIPNVLEGREAVKHVRHPVKSL